MTTNPSSTNPSEAIQNAKALSKRLKQAQGGDAARSKSDTLPGMEPSPEALAAFRAKTKPAPVTHARVASAPPAPAIVEQGNPVSPREFDLISAGAAIAMDQPTDSDKAFLAKQLVQATLPHTDPGEVPVWSRRNGSLTLAIQQGYNPDGTSIGHPYGTIPRLILYWLTTEALRLKEKNEGSTDFSKRIELGDSLGSFMRELGLDPRRGGARSDRVRLEQQMRRLFAARISFVAETTSADGKVAGIGTRYMDIAEQTVFWWDVAGKSSVYQSSLWESFIVVHDSFFRQLTDAAVPVDMRAVGALQRSPLALDLYNLMAYNSFRAHKSGKPVYMTFKQMQAALGTNYKDVDNVKKAVKSTLTKVLAVYPGLKLTDRQGGIEVHQASRPAIPVR